MEDLTCFAIPSALRFEETAEGLTRAIISTAQAEAEIYIYGAHITHWTPAGQRPVLFTSTRSFFTPGKPIRGGVPLVFPWFGPRSDGQHGPMHGFARTQNWTLQATRQRPDGTVELDLTLPPSDISRDLGYPEFDLAFHIAIGAQLEMELQVRNNTSADLAYEEAMHTYFAVGDIHQVSLYGLEETEYLDKADNFTRKRRPDEPIRISRYTDQVHVNTTTACVIEDPAWARRIVIGKTNSATTVVWNPWSDKTPNFADMAPGEWPGMLCVETANAGENALRLAPGASHWMGTTIHVE